MKKLTLILIAAVSFIACNQDSKTVNEQDSVINSEMNSNEKPVEIADVPWAAVTDTTTQKIAMVKSDLVTENDLSPENVIEALGRKYPEIKLVWLKQQHDTAFVSIPDANYLTRGSGSMGAQIFLSETTYSFTSIPGIKFVNYAFKEGDHASPGTFTRQDFEFKEQGLNL
ncbi:MAG: hypothetical protein ABIP95_14555 [Pelobium sp.]